MHTPVVTIALLLAVLSTSCDSTAATFETDVTSTPSTTRPTILLQRSDTRRTHIALVGVDGSDESAPLTGFGNGNQTNPESIGRGGGRASAP